MAYVPYSVSSVVSVSSIEQHSTLYNIPTSTIAAIPTTHDIPKAYTPESHIPSTSSIAIASETPKASYDAHPTSISTTAEIATTPAAGYSAKAPISIATTAAVSSYVASVASVASTKAASMPAYTPSAINGSNATILYSGAMEGNVVMTSFLLAAVGVVALFV
ncbi:hypothetical protein HDU76_011217 [Blyttiomyces sp. JEL0837]|nr:hypothetical protein HDU76_011217 [Blyttiomyces sp. JEL0837]